jgi:hypothetical protein
MNVMSEPLRKAFALAHRAAESDSFDVYAREVFRQIAYYIWQSAGRPKDYPAIARTAVPALPERPKEQ